jgi:hypothetical protein
VAGEAGNSHVIVIRHDSGEIGNLEETVNAVAGGSAGIIRPFVSGSVAAFAGVSEEHVEAGETGGVTQLAGGEHRISRNCYVIVFI